ncbi:hypothetical protein FD718_10285 [Photobacterium damselae subsp. damselae]|nr:hypothetical protein FD718_10285 [Photobacterium damselae subsp. damselae]
MYYHNAISKYTRNNHTQHLWIHSTNKTNFINLIYFKYFLAPFGVFISNLAAISATTCMNKDVDIDERKRYLSVLWAGCFHIIAGLFSGFVVKTFLSLPTDLILRDPLIISPKHNHV